MLICGNAFAEDEKDKTKSKLAEARKDLKELHTKLRAVHRKLELNKDEDLIKLREAVKEAQMPAGSLMSTTRREMNSAYVCARSAPRIHAST